MLATAKCAKPGDRPLKAIAARCVPFAVLAVTSGAGAVTAQDFVIPETCTAVVTAHNNSCSTTTMLNCGAEGWKGVSYVRGQLSGVSHYSTHWNFVKWETEGAARMVIEIVPGSGAAMDVRDLREKGEHVAEAEFVINTKVLKDQGYVLTGTTKPTGEVVMLGDEAFDVFEGVRTFERRGAKATLNFRFDLLFSQTRDLMLEGRSARAVNNTGWREFAMEPIALRGPGEDGFLATMSEFGC